jgi:hypothetical protein
MHSRGGISPLIELCNAAPTGLMISYAHVILSFGEATDMPPLWGLTVVLPRWSGRLAKLISRAPAGRHIGSLRREPEDWMKTMNSEPRRGGIIVIPSQPVIE